MKNCLDKYSWFLSDNSPFYSMKKKTRVIVFDNVSLNSNFKSRSVRRKILNNCFQTHFTVRFKLHFCMIFYLLVKLY